MHSVKSISLKTHSENQSQVTYCLSHCGQNIGTNASSFGLGVPIVNTVFIVRMYHSLG